MAIQLGYEENFNEGLKRLVLEECETAKAAIENAHSIEEKHQAVHEVRKAFKKIRACLRLVRDHYDGYKQQNIFFRDLGRLISEVRDASSNIEAVDAIKQQYGGRLYQNSFIKLRNDLLEYRDELAVRDFKQNDRLSEIHESLSRKMEEIPGWPWQVQSFEDIQDSLRRVYKRGRKGYHNSLEDGTAKDYHEWRKRMKYLRYQVDVLNRIWPQFMEALEDEMHEMTDFTGQLHDLHNLKVTVKKRNSRYSTPEEKILFYALVEKQEDFMKRHALLKGRKFYHRKPSRFVKDMELYWETHQTGLREPYLPRPQQLEY